MATLTVTVTNKGQVEVAHIGFAELSLIGALTRADSSICVPWREGDKLGASCRTAGLQSGERRAYTFHLLVDPTSLDQPSVRRAETFGPMYTRARDIGYDSIAERILELGEAKSQCIGPDGYIDNGEIQRLRMLSENRKWLLAKLRPKQYGDKVTQEITGEDGGALITRIELVPVAARPRPVIEHSGHDTELTRNERSRRKPQKP